MIFDVLLFDKDYDFGLLILLYNQVCYHLLLVSIISC